ncbi:MAG: type III-B CRISPR module RAMP protein Cmr4 [Bacteroidia bacterium]|nr:type III-B CRISPR module RAMP protein Cmr4 [Bacteroidia bacterium]
MAMPLTSNNMTHTSALFLRTLSSLHAGTGDDNGLVDLPIQRELVTGYPKIEASSLKGAIRSRVEQFGGDPTKIHLAFGYDDQSIYKSSADFSGDGGDSAYARYFAGALTFTDARILLFPIRSMWGVFAQVTCPYVLKRLAEDLGLSAETFSITEDFGDGEVLSSAPILQQNRKMILEEYAFSVKSATNIANALNQHTGIDISRLVVVSDNVFGDFTQLFTERMTRNKIDDTTGVVRDGGLFTEEYLPPEAMLYSLVIADAPRQPKSEEGKNKALPSDFSTAEHIRNFITQDCWGGADKKKVLQIGGNTTVGKGLTELTFKSVQP